MLSKISATMIATSVLSFTAMADTYQGTLIIASGASTVTLGSVNLSAGQATMDVGGRGFFSSGNLSLETSAGKLSIGSFEKASLPNFEGTEIADYGRAISGVNIIGAPAVDTKRSEPVVKNETCTFRGRDLQTIVNVPTGQVDQGGIALTKPVPVTVTICVWATSQANTKSEVKITSTGYCEGSQIEKFQTVTQANVYKLKFVDPKTGQEIARFEGQQAPSSYNQDLGSLSDCK